MAWFKIDDGFWSHPKVITLPAAAGWLWVRAGTYSMQHLTDGVIPDPVVAVLGAVEDAEALVACGLWLKVDGGYAFHDWGEYQPSRESVEAERERNAQRQREWRERRRESQRKNAGTNGGSNALRNGGTNNERNPQNNASVTLPRPDPTRPSSKEDIGGTKKAPEKPLPEDWTPTDTHRKYATEHGIDIEHEEHQFKAHAEANDRRQRSWNGAFTSWLGNAKKWAKPKPVQESSGAWMARTEVPKWMES